jgi:hypothetical protein
MMFTKQQIVEPLDGKHKDIAGLEIAVLKVLRMLLHNISEIERTKANRGLPPDKVN